MIKVLRVARACVREVLGTYGIGNAEIGRVEVEMEGVSLRFATRSPAAREFFYGNAIPDRVYERPVTRTLKRCCGPETCFLDVGAHLGLFSCFVGALAPRGSVHAFELDPVLAAEIAENAELNELDNVHVVAGAVLDRAGELVGFKPHIPGDETTNVATTDGQAASLQVPSITLDGYCEQKDIGPDVAKIDVEGAEVRTLRGMSHVLDGLETLLLEVHPSVLPRFGDGMDDVAELLREHALAPHRLDHGGRTVRPAGLSYDEVAQVEDNILLYCTRTASD